MFDAFAAAATSGDPLLDWLSRAGALGVMATAVVAFARGWIVSGKAYEQVRAERERALELVYAQAQLAHKAVSAAERRAQLEAELARGQEGSA